MIKACLFDLDGTILDTIKTIAHYGNTALGEFGIEPIEVERYNYLAGKGAKHLVEGMLWERNCYCEELFEKVFNFYMQSYDANPTHLTEPFEGICPLLKSLKCMGIKTAVISNKPDFATKYLCKEKFEEGMLDIVRGHVDGVKLKPATDGALMILGELGVKENEVLYVGDTDIDMQTGKNLGAYTVGVLWGFRSEEELRKNGADRIVLSPMEISKIAEELNSSKI